MHLRRLDFFFIKDDIISLIWSCRRKYLLIRLGLGTSTFSSQIITKNYFLVVSCVKWLDIKIQFIIYNYYLQKDYKLSWISWKSKCLFDMGNRLGHKPLFFFFFFYQERNKDSIRPQKYNLWVQMSIDFKSSMALSCSSFVAL